MIGFGAMVYAPQGAGSRLVQVAACEPGFPFYGTIETDPPGAFANLSSGGAVVDPSLLAALGVKVGETLALGQARFTIRGTIVKVPGDVGVRAALGPRVFIAFAKVAETGLVIFGSRARHELFLKLATAVPIPSGWPTGSARASRWSASTSRTVAEGQQA